MASRSKVTEIGTHKGDGGKGKSLFRGKYAPESFIIPGQDANGNSVRVFCRIVPMLERAIDVIHGTKKFPFKSKGDLVRWCIKRGVEELNDMEPVVGSVLAQVDAMMMVLRDEELNHEWIAVFASMHRTIGMHLQAQAVGEARRVVATMKAMIAKIDNDYWRNRYMKELDDKFGYLLKGEGARIGDHTDSGRDPGTDADEDDE